jgi:tetratricopeptide (TPR) repeat protein
VKQRYTEGMTLLTQGRKVEAQDCFQRTLEDVAFERDIIGNARFSALRKVRGLCFKMLGQIAQEHGDKDAALHRWGNALAMDDKDVVMWHNLGCLAHELSRLNVARCAFERGLELRPNNPLFLDKLCEVTYHIGDFGACRSACELLLALAPAHPRGLVYKGLLLCMQPATESQGLGLLEDAQEAAGAMSVHDVAQLRDLERKRPRLEPAPQDPPHAIALCKPDLRCLLDKLLELLPARADEPEAPTPALAVRPSSMHHNHLCVVSLDESRPAQLEAGTSRNAGRNEGTQAVATLNVDDNATRDADMGVLDGEDVAAAVVYEDKDALCMVCGGDVDPGDFPGDDLLLCENFERCGQSYHTTCLCPAIKEPPGDDEQWFCPKCDPRPPAESPGISVATQEVAPAFSSLPASENSVGSATGASGDGGDEASPGKRSGARRSRTSNVVVTAAPSRKSKRQSQADTDKRPPLVVQLSRILDLVSETGSEDVAEEEDIPPSPRPAPEAAATAPKCWECQGETLSRYEMLWKLGSATCTHEKIIAQLLEKLKLRPTCLLEVVHKLVHLLAASACTVRLRGKVLDAALDLDAAVRQRLTYAPEASLFFAELNLDRYEARLKDSAREYAEQEAEGNDEPSSSQDVALIDENSCDALLAELPKSKAAWTQRYLAAFNFHIKGLWCERFEGWREQARYLWLLSNHATCHREPWNVLEPLHRCRAVMEAAHADAEAACIYLPSCQLNNHITVKGIEKRLLGPQQEVRDMMLDQQARELDLAMTEAREQLQVSSRPYAIHRRPVHALSSFSQQAEYGMQLMALALSEPWVTLPVETGYG